MNERYEHRSVSLADQVFERLENDILSGKYNKGEILTEVRLSEILKVSRTPVREAMCRLEQEHIVSRTSNGYVVIGMSPDDINMIYEIRLRTEGLAARLAAERASEEQKNELSEILALQKFHMERGDAEREMDCDSRFHRVLYEAGGSIPLRDTLYMLHKRIIRFRRASVEMGERAKHSYLEHLAICEAVKKGDGDLAERLATEHIINARDSIMKKILPDDNGKPAGDK